MDARAPPGTSETWSASGKGLTKSFTVGYFGERLALLMALANVVRRIAKGKKGQHVQIISNVQE